MPEDKNKKIKRLTREETWQRLLELGVVEGEMPPELTWEEIELGKRYEVKNTEFPKDAPLIGADLRFFYLSGAVLEQANLSGAALNLTNLSGAKLYGANLSGATLNFTNLSGAKLNGAVLSGTKLLRANLSGAEIACADLSGARLNDARFVSIEEVSPLIQKPAPQIADISGATLRNADLTRAVLYLKEGDNEYSVKGIIAEQFGGANLSSAEIPLIMRQEQWLDALADASKNSRNTFLILMTLCYFSIIALLSPNETKLHIPIFQLDIERDTFLWSTPLALLTIFTYFQFNMQRYWEMLSESPAIFPDGKTYEKHIYPWLANSMAALYFKRIERKPGFMYPQIIVVAFFLWVAVPATLAGFYAYSGNSLPVLLIAFIGAWISAVFAVSMDRMMEHGKVELLKSPAFWVVNAAALAVIVSILPFLLFQ